MKQVHSPAAVYLEEGAPALNKQKDSNNTAAEGGQRFDLHFYRLHRNPFTCLTNKDTYLV